MENSGDFRTRIVSGFIVICIAIIAISGAFLFQNYLDLPVFSSVLVGIVFFLLFYLLHSLRLARREINDLKYYLDGPSDMEDGLIRRIDDLSRQIASSDLSAVKNSIKTVAKDCAANSASIQQVSKDLSIISNRIDEAVDQNLSQNTPDNSSQENKIIPLRMPKEPVVTPQSISDQSAESNHIVSDDFDAETNVVPENAATDLAEHGRNRTLVKRLRTAVEFEELELHLQPIVKLLDREPEFYESTLHMKDDDGEYVKQQRLVRLVDSERLTTAFDSQLLHSAIRVLRTLNELQKRTGLLCPISPATLKNNEVFEDIHALLRANVALAGSLVLEIDQSALDELGTDGRDHVAQLVDLGYSFLLNNINRFDLDGALLHAAGFRKLKVSVNALLKISDDGNIDEQVTDFSEEMENCGLTVIVCDIEHESQVMHLIDFDLPLGQGALFSPSRPVKPGLLKVPDQEDGVSGVNTA